jgi:hypothetical protein
VLAWTAACDGDFTGPASGEFQVRFVVSNSLLAPVTIAIDGAPYLILTGGASSSLTVSSKAQWLTWNSAKPMDASGQPILDDIGEIRIAVSSINNALDISNLIGGHTYITARFLNLTTANVSIGVYDGSSVSCAARLPAASGPAAGYTQIGYYKLLASTEVRAYRDPVSCSGAYSSWPSGQIRDYEAKSGLLSLVLESAP